MTVGTPRGRRALVLGTLAMVVAAASACSTSADVSPSTSGSPSTTATTAADSSVCGYYYEWTSKWTFALQPDPHAAYTYVIPKVTTDPIGYEITGDFPYAAWTSWTIYDAQAKPFSLATDSKITPDAGSVNPFVVGNPVLAPKRSFTLLVLPQGTDTGAIEEAALALPRALAAAI